MGGNACYPTPLPCIELHRISFLIFLFTRELVFQRNAKFGTGTAQFESYGVFFVALF